MKSHIPGVVRKVQILGRAYNGQALCLAIVCLTTEMRLYRRPASPSAAVVGFLVYQHQTRSLIYLSYFQQLHAARVGVDEV